MKAEIMIAVLALLCIGSLAAFFVAWAKADEFKRNAKDEHECYEAMRRMYSGLSALAQEKDAVIAMLHERICAETKYAYQEMLGCVKMEKQRDNLQDRLSALLCPMNDHVWKDGVCVKCGRMQDG